jgi:hypothetical protein
MPSVKPAFIPSSPAVVEPDAHGQAALLLTESLIHALVDNATLTAAEAVDVVTIAAEVKVEVATASGESQGRMRESLALLSKIMNSFAADRPKGSR